MKLLLVAACLLVLVHCQTQHGNGNPTGEFDEFPVESKLRSKNCPLSRLVKFYDRLKNAKKERERRLNLGRDKRQTLTNARDAADEDFGTRDPLLPVSEIGQPAFDEIIVESTLTVRGKPGSRSGKALVTKPKEPEASQLVAETADGASVTLKRNRRAPWQRFGRFPQQNLHGFPLGSLGSGFPGSSSSAAHASSNAFNSNTPFGSFGASASQSSSQSQHFGPGGFGGSAGQSASQTYRLPNGCKVDVSFSNAFSVSNGRPTASNSHSFTITLPDGTVQEFHG